MSQTDTEAPATGQETPPAPSAKEQAAAVIDNVIRTGETSPSTPAPDGQPADDAPAYTPSRRARAAAKHLGRSETDIANLTEDSARDLIEISRTVRAREKAASDTDNSSNDSAPGSDGADGDELSEESEFDDVLAGYKTQREENRKLRETMAAKDKKSEAARQQQEQETVRTEMDSWFGGHDTKLFPEFEGVATVDKDSAAYDARQELIDEVELRYKQYDDRDIDKTRNEVIAEALQHLYPDRFITGSGVKSSVARPSGTAKPPAAGQTPQQEATAKMDEHIAQKGYT